jgi:hypothetical protein
VRQGPVGLLHDESSRAFKARLKATMTASGDLVLDAAAEKVRSGPEHICRMCGMISRRSRGQGIWLLVRAAFPATAYWPAMRVILLRSPPDGEEQAAMVITDPPLERPDQEDV